MQHDAVLILIAGVLLATGVCGVARRRQGAAPGAGRLPRHRHGDRHATGSAWIDFNDYGARALDRDGGTRPHPVRGRASTGLQEIRPVLRSAVVLAVLGTMVTALVAGLAAAWLFDLSTEEGLLLGAILSATDGAAVFALLRGSHLPDPARADARGRGGVQRPGGRAAGRRARRARSRRPATARSTAACSSCASSGSGRDRGCRRRRCGGSCSAGWRGRRRACCWSRRPRPPRSRTERRARSAARASSRSTWPASCSGTRVVPSRRGDPRVSLRAWPRSPRSGCSWRSGCWSSRASSATCSSRARCSGWSWPASRGRSRRPAGNGLRAYTAAERTLIGWAGLRGAVPVILATIPVHRRRPAEPRVLQHRVLRSARLDGPPGQHASNCWRPASG